MSNIASLTPMQKGERRGGRAKGQVNKVTRALKHALILAAEKSVHSKDRSLESYCTFLADEHPTTFAGLLGRLIPVQLKAKGDVRVDLERIKLNMNMSLPEMIANFEAKIKSDYCVPPRALIEHDDDDDESDA